MAIAKNHSAQNHSAQNLLCILAVLLCSAVPSFAQVDRAVLEGSVTDPTGGIVPGAKVSILHVATGISQDRHTNSNGYYRFPGLQVGFYTVTVTNNSFKTKIVDNVELLVGQSHTLDVRLDLGTVAEKVEIHAEAAPSDRSSAEASTVIREAQIQNLPNNGRDWASFTLFAPFAQDDGGGDQRTIRFAGRARDDNNFQFDGVDAGGIQEQAQKSQTRLQISQDAIAEYRVNSALYTAEYGTQAGGQINVVTKSGGNDLHGTVFGYLRNSVFDARNFNDFDVNNHCPTVPSWPIRHDSRRPNRQRQNLLLHELRRTPPTAIHHRPTRRSFACHPKASVANFLSAVLHSSGLSLACLHGHHRYMRSKICSTGCCF
jgi:hypothetical protein